MPIPKPKVPLKDHCSVIHDGKLYTYQEDAFQSLELKEGGQWDKLDLDTPTKGSTCSLGEFDDQAALIIVGGTSEKEYHGIQHYIFKDEKWKADRPADEVATNRLRHGAVFLQKSSQILTYGGSQDSKDGLSSQTFVISTKSPYSTSAYNSEAPPVSDPILLQYNASHALMLGGSLNNQKLFVFGPDDGWNELDQDLNGTLQDKGKMQASIFTGSDGSKLLEIFDMNASPNSLSSLNLGTGTKQQKRADYAVAPHHPHKRRKRDTSVKDRPALSDDFLPKDSRSGFSLASDPDSGLLIMSGGNDQSPIAMFNNTGNAWIDPDRFFSGTLDEQQTSASASPSPTSPSTVAAAPTFSPTAAPTEVAQKSNSSKGKSLTILGGTLGGVLGAILLLAIILLLLRHSKKKRKIQRELQQEEKAGRKSDMDFMDMGAEFMRSAGGSAAGSNHEREKPDPSIQKNHSRGASTQSKRALLHAKGDSEGSQHSFWSRTSTKSPVQSTSHAPSHPPQISAPIISGPSLTRSIGSPGSRDENGWSRYFMDNNGLGRSNSAKSGSLRPDTFASQAHTSSSYAPSNGHSSAEVEPLNFRPSQIYPPTGLGVALSHGVSRASPQRSPTPSVVSDIEEESEYHHSNSNSQGPETWSPVVSSNGGEGSSQFTSSDHRISSNTNSFSYQQTTERIRIPNFPMPSSGASSVASPSTPVLGQGEQPPIPIPPRSDKREQQGMRNVVSKDLIRTNSGKLRATGVVRTGTQRVSPSNSTGPTARPFPRHSEQRNEEGHSEDMSWLNLGTSAEQARGIYAPR